MRGISSRLACCGAVAIVFSAPIARADEKALCIAASEQGQEERDNGNYRRASEDFATCARESCPQLVRDDCTKWRSDLEQSWPSVVFSAKDEKGNELVDVRVSVDGERIVSRLEGKGVPLDPGDHVVRYEADGYPPVSGHLLVRSGEKDRGFSLRMVLPPPPPAAAPPVQREVIPPPLVSRRSMAPALVLGSLALVAFGSEAFFGLSALSERSALLSQPCAQTATCPQSSVDSIRTKYTVADVSLGVGVVSAGLATYFFFWSAANRRAPAPPAALLDFAPRPGGGQATLGGRF